MKKLWIVILIIMLLLTVGCAQSKDNSNLNTGNEISENTNEINNNAEQKIDSNNGIVKNEIPILTEEEALSILKEVRIRYMDVSFLGNDISSDCTYEHQGEIVEVDGKPYIYFYSCLDTLEELYEYLGVVLTDKSIEATMEDQNIIEYEGYILHLYADVGSKPSGDTKVLSINQKDEIAVVEIDVPLIREDTQESDIKEITYVYNKDKGWLIDTETPFDDFW